MHTQFTCVVAESKKSEAREDEVARESEGDSHGRGRNCPVEKRSGLFVVCKNEARMKTGKAAAAGTAPDMVARLPRQVRMGESGLPGTSGGESNCESPRARARRGREHSGMRPTVYCVAAGDLGRKMADVIRCGRDVVEVEPTRRKPYGMCGDSQDRGNGTGRRK